MDILNFISWIRGRRQVTSVDPTKTLLPVALKDGRRDDEYLTGAISVEDFTTQVASSVPPGPQGLPGPQGPQGVPGPVGPAGLNWQGAWSASGIYVVDDAVGYAGASYFCINNVGPSAIPPSTDLTNWALLASQGAIGPQGPAGPPSNGVKIIASAPTFGTSVTGVTGLAISRVVDISGLLSPDSTIEISWGTNVVISTANVTSQIFLSTTPLLSGSLGQIATSLNIGTGSGNDQYSRSVRHISNVNTAGTSTFRMFNPATPTATEFTSSNNTLVSISSINLSGPLYLLFAINLSSASSLARVDRVVINEFPATIL